MKPTGGVLGAAIDSDESKFLLVFFKEDVKVLFNTCWKTETCAEKVMSDEMDRISAAYIRLARTAVQSCLRTPAD
ncbi:hypothetical protein FHG87_006419 [Trinorchestia longiramus]|nr:hypothetical protein FHG87_006419 [Trinorchestia longiramus]